MVKELIVPEEYDTDRIDKVIFKLDSSKGSRNQIQLAIKAGNVKLNGQVIKLPSHKVAEGDKISWEPIESVESTLKSQKIDLNIIYQDHDLMVINKPPGLIVHPGAGVNEGTLANGLLYHLKNIQHVGESFRPGIVHRIDKDTSGLLVVAKNTQTHEFLSAQFKSHDIERQYLAVVKGNVQHDQGRCEEPIGKGKVFRKKMRVGAVDAKTAITNYRVKERLQTATVLEVRLETGRTHQIRVHMAYLGYPILGDTLYGVQSQLIDRQALHAQTLGFIHPVSKEKMRFEAEVPEDIQLLINELRKSS